MKKLSELKIWVSALTNEIYAGYRRKNGRGITQKVNITGEVMAAVMAHMDNDPVGKGKGVVIYCDGGELTWRRKGKQNEL